MKLLKYIVSKILLGLTVILLPALVYHFYNDKLAIIVGLCEIIMLQVASTVEIISIREHIIEYIEKQKNK